MTWLQAVGTRAFMLALAILIGSRQRSPALSDASYMLEPQVRTVISTICDRIEPALRCTDTVISRAHVVARLSPEAGADTPCFTLRLEHPSVDCAETHWGQFCARFPDGDPPPSLLAVVRNALIPTAEQDIWAVAQPPADPLPERSDADPGRVARTVGTSLAVTLAPLATGWFLGAVWRRRGRKHGVLFTTAVIALPAVSCVSLDVPIELIGVWDALLIGIVAGTGMLLALHRAFADWKGVVLLMGASVASVLALEIASRLMLPPPPAFPSLPGPALLMSNAIRAARLTGFSTTQAGLTTCHAIYGDDCANDTVPPTAFPLTWKPRAGAGRHILHLGDSVVFGSDMDGRFTDHLNRIEPNVEHVNAAIAGTAPDVYLALTRLFIVRHDFAAVVMHLTPNDFYGLDEPQYPCSDWQSLLEYGPSGPRLRFADEHPRDLERSHLSWMVQNSPPPYVLRACVRFSAFAAHLAAAWVHLARRLGHAPADVDDGVREAHLAVILRAARDELRARHIALVVDSFHDRLLVESGQPPAANTDDAKMHRIAADLGIVTIDTWQPLVAAVQRGVQPFTNAGGPTDSHFSADGHALIAEWLHEQLPRAIDQARPATPAGTDARTATSP